MSTISFLNAVRPAAHARYRQLPVFGELLDGFVDWARTKGYTNSSIYLQLDSVRRLARWLRRRGQSWSVADLSEAAFSPVKRQFASRARDVRYVWGLDAFIKYLRQTGRIAALPSPAPTRTQIIITSWLSYLREDRGRCQSTLDVRRRHITHFLRFIRFERNEHAIKNLRLESVQKFLAQASRGLRRSTIQHLVASLREFLRYQFLQGAIASPMHLWIDSVRIHRSEDLPCAIDWPQLKRVLARVDRSMPMGLRDFAIVLLAATYGLRASDVAKLTLDDVAWRDRSIHIVQQKTRAPLSLPLTDEVAGALTDYLRRARPTGTPFRQIFLRVCAPHAPLSLPGTANTLRRASASAGVPLKAAGFRCMRHALALRLIRQGSTIKQVGDLLGHHSPISTFQYLRLNVDDLRELALPVPRSSRSARPLSPPTPADCASTSKCHRRRGARTAPKGWVWRSRLGPAMRRYLDLRRSLGRQYESHERALLGLDYFLRRRYPRASSITAGIFDQWAKGLASLCPTTARMRMTWIRQFCRHLARLRASAFVPDLRTFPKEVPHAAPTLITGSEVARVLDATSMLRCTKSNPLHARTLRIAFTLSYCCGLRRGEVLKLTLGDIDPTHGTLRIVESKFNKSRMIPVSPSMTRELRDYLAQRRRRGMPIESEAPLVWNGYTSRVDALTATPLWMNWKRCCKSAKVANKRGQPPRMHDLRHSFAVEVLRRGYTRGREPGAVLPRLARYMGHAGAQFTHYYLKFTEPLRAAAAARSRPGLPPRTTRSTHSAVSHQVVDGSGWMLRRRQGGGR
jgi:integrase/recombinase XerD